MTPTAKNRRKVTADAASARRSASRLRSVASRHAPTAARTRMGHPTDCATRRKLRPVRTYKGADAGRVAVRGDAESLPVAVAAAPDLTFSALTYTSPKWR